MAKRPARKRKAKTPIEVTVTISRDEDGYYVASVLELPGCHTQAKTLEQLTARLKEAIAAAYESYVAAGLMPTKTTFIGLQRMAIPA